MWLTGKSRSKIGFILVELMVSVVIISIGLVLVVSGHSTAMSALQTAQNRIHAVRFAEEKMAEIEQEARQAEGIDIGAASEGEFVVGNEKFNWQLAISPAGTKEDLDLGEELNEVKLTVSWVDRRRTEDVSVVTYLKKKK